MRLLDHAGNNWLKLTKVRARYHGTFAYITGVLPNGEQIPLFGSATAARPTPSGSRSTPPPATATKTPSCSPGAPGSPQEALDTACTVHLTALGHEPEP